MSNRARHQPDQAGNVQHSTTMTEQSIDRKGSGGALSTHVDTEKGQVLPVEKDVLTGLGYTPELTRNRSMFTLLFQSLAIAAIPYGEGGPLISAIYGGGQLSIFVGWICKFEKKVKNMQ